MAKAVFLWPALMPIKYLALNAETIVNLAAEPFSPNAPEYGEYPFKPETSIGVSFSEAFDMLNAVGEKR